MKVHVFRLKAFTCNNQGGNPAGVVLNADKLTTEQMQFVAKTVGYSETAFVSKSPVADFKVRFFTPNTEVDLCGHATIATYSCMYSQQLVKPGIYKQELKAGNLDVEILPDGNIVMDQTQPEFLDIIPTNEIAEVLTVPVEKAQTTSPPQIVSTGLRDLLVEIDTKETLNKLDPDMAKMTKLQKKYMAESIHAYSLESNDENMRLSTRNFAPILEIPEESATGSANGALVSYLFKNNTLSAPDVTQGIWIEQGYSMGESSAIFVKLQVQNNMITRVQVGGLGSVIDHTEVVV
jgi:PhzF family phenazine biosynthesis protein